MRSVTNLLCLISMGGPLPAATLSFQIVAPDRGAWSEALASIGLVESKTPDVVVLPPGAPAADWLARVNRGTIVIVEGESPAAAAFGFHAVEPRITVTVRIVIDHRAPK